MANPLFDAIERKQLADLFDELGPDAPTLLEPWTTRDLAAHLVLREHDYLAAPGLVLPGAWGRFAERRRTALAREDFPWLVATIRSGPEQSSIPVDQDLLCGLLGSGGVVGPFDEFAVLELRAGADERHEMGRVDRPPA